MLSLSLQRSVRLCPSDNHFLKIQQSLEISVYLLHYIYALCIPLLHWDNNFIIFLQNPLYKKNHPIKDDFFICVHYFLFLIFAFTTVFEITILTFFCPRNLFRRHPKTIPIMYPIPKVTMTSKIHFPRVAWVMTYTGWMKCNPKIRSINFCIPVGVIAIATAQIRCINATKVPKTNPVLNLLIMRNMIKK